MLFMTNLFVSNLLKLFRSCQFTGQLVRSQLAPWKENSSNELLLFFTESLVTKANALYDVHEYNIKYKKWNITCLLLTVCCHSRYPTICIDKVRASSSLWFIISMTWCSVGTSGLFWRSRGKSYHKVYYTECYYSCSQ